VPAKAMLDEPRLQIAPVFIMTIKDMKSVFLFKTYQNVVVSLNQRPLSRRRDLHLIMDLSLQLEFELLIIVRLLSDLHRLERRA